MCEQKTFVSDSLVSTSNPGLVGMESFQAKGRDLLEVEYEEGVEEEEVVADRVEGKRLRSSVKRVFVVS